MLRKLIHLDFACICTIQVVSCSGGASQLPLRAPPSREVRPSRFDPTPRSQAALHYMRSSRQGEPERAGRLRTFANRLMGICV